MSTAIERRLNRIRKERGLRKSQALVFSGEREQVRREGVTIPDIDYGAWTYIGQPAAPDYPGEKFAFLE